MTKWQIENEKERRKLKFLKAGTEIDVIIESEPKIDAKVKGKFGERLMYVLDTVSYGVIYVSPKQFMKIANGIGDKTKGIYHTEL